MGFNFKDVEVPVEITFVRPGFWKLAPTKAELIKKENKVPYLEITFEGEAGKMKDKFYLSEKAISRLQYLHIELYEKRLEKSFENDHDLEAYFNTLFSKKRILLNLVVGGEETTDGKLYTSLPYAGFVSSDPNYKEGAFEKNTTEYNNVVKKSNVPVNSDVIQTPYASTSKGSTGSDFPWDTDD